MGTFCGGFVFCHTHFRDTAYFFLRRAYWKKASEAGEKDMYRDIWQKIAEWKKRNGRDLAVWTAFVAAGALLMMCGAAAAGCGERNRQEQQNETEGRGGNRTEEGETEGESDAWNTEGKAISNFYGQKKGRISGGSSGKITYEIHFREKEYEADDGTGIFVLKLSYPVLLGSGEGIGEVNGFFERWADEKLREYESDENSTRQSALEVYRESRDAGWAGPWGEEYKVSSVGVLNGYVSVLMDSYLYEGSVHGMPYRETYAFDLADGRRAELTEMSELTQREWERLLRERFREKISQEEGYYADAQEIMQQFDFRKAGWYFADGGIVFYLPPYTVAPYDAGYVEISVPFEEARIK